MPESPYFAAIDLGSNSFHMLIAVINEGHLSIIDREKEMVQIARGLDKHGNLDDDARQRALDCLHRFSERLRDMPNERVRAVGTKTLRSTKNANDFLTEAEQKLGQPIQIISGFEEARLVYCGLSHSVSNDHSQRLVIDIGGGSTEFIIGHDEKPVLMESLSIGCVAYTNRYFLSGTDIHRNMRRAYLATCQELEAIRKPYIRNGWQIVYGTSGTMKAIGSLVSQNGSSTITRESLEKIWQHVINDNGLSSYDNIPTLRRDVLPAGIAILKAVFDQLNILELRVADATLKEGLIFDTIGRLSAHDTREQTVAMLHKRYNIDTEQSTRVTHVATALWQKIKQDTPNLSRISRSKILRWACMLYEIGLSISHSSHHKHGYYLLQNSDLAGFGRFEQFILASLVGMHRNKLNNERMEKIDKKTREAFIPILLCLRLSTLFNRRREDLDTVLSLQKVNNNFELKIDTQWLAEHPLTQTGLQREQDELEKIHVHLTIV